MRSRPPKPKENAWARSVSETNVVAELALDLFPSLRFALKSSFVCVSINGIVTFIRGMPCFPSSGWDAIFTTERLRREGRRALYTIRRGVFGRL